MADVIAETKIEPLKPVADSEKMPLLNGVNGDRKMNGVKVNGVQSKEKDDESPELVTGQIRSHHKGYVSLCRHGWVL